ncbi:hypothetical protein N7492_010085 [Penicillium capsulatum]|uniref:Uncharacterized protein n=1 Tax=Penicillium capsulatum TaxID=69766 RepID=A0A9W9LF33_9EURO|nr:hypothetical protein N7492_010085 [Penicillium capsulatum]KAJ6112594.1 hypothetical protein N7512_007918 [Penicillium capsulatum]
MFYPGTGPTLTKTTMLRDVDPGFKGNPHMSWNVKPVWSVSGYDDSKGKECKGTRVEQATKIDECYSLGKIKCFKFDNARGYKIQWYSGANCENDSVHRAYPGSDPTLMTKAMLDDPPPELRDNGHISWNIKPVS